MITINTNSLSMMTQRHLDTSTCSFKKSIERLSTGFKINRAADNASNLSISKNMNCQISGTTVAQENTQQAIGLLDTADSAISTMTDMLQRIRELSLQAMNGTYSVKEREMMQQEVQSLAEEVYRQKNSTKYNQINIFGEIEDVSQQSGVQGSIGTHAVDKLTEDEAVAQGYTVIKTANDLLNCNTNVANGKFILMNDIDLSGVTWTGKNVNASAIFDGNGYSIRNLTSDKGLFVNNAGTIKNLNITNANINGTGYIGILANSNSGTIENCSSSGNISITENYAGGLVGNNNGTIKNSTSSATVKGVIGVGGIAGSSGTSSVIENSKATGDVIGSQHNIGGLVGTNAGKIKNSTADNNVSGEQLVGGLVGNNSGEIENTNSTGTTSASYGEGGGLVGRNSGALKSSVANGKLTGGNSLGGLVGTNKGTVEHSTSTVTVKASGDNIGGAVGLNQGTVKTSIANGDISGKGSVGGFVGSNDSAGAHVENCGAAGKVVATGSFSGGFVGEVRGTIDNSYALGNVSAKAGCSGGFAGHLENATITNSYSKGDVNSSSFQVGGFVGHSFGTKDSISNCYSYGDVNSDANLVGGFVGAVYNQNALKIENSYTSGEVNSPTANAGAFIDKNSLSNVVISNCYSNSDQPAGIIVEQAGITNKKQEWFDDTKNLNFLGAAFDYSTNPPELFANKEIQEFSIELQIGANFNRDNRLEIETGFSLQGFYADVSSVERATETLDRVDEMLNLLNTKRSQIGASRNKLEGVINSQSITLENLSASHSALIDVDFAKETANLAKSQILQNTTSSLLAQTNVMPQIALNLL